MDTKVEICCGGYYDALEAAAGGAKRIELNSALHLGGLTPGISALLLAKRETDLEVICMDRPRAAGFCYGPEDFKTMLFDCQLMMHHGADGIAFGCLRADGSIDLAQTELMVRAVKEKGGAAVFHRAFDCVADPYGAVEQLIRLGVDRILTSGQQAKAPDGCDLIRSLVKQYGGQIEILAGSGINEQNVVEFVKKTGVTQVHSSCKDWIMDPTTVRQAVSFAYAPGEQGACFEAVSRDKVKALLEAIKSSN